MVTASRIIHCHDTQNNSAMIASNFEGFTNTLISFLSICFNEILRIVYQDIFFETNFTYFAKKQS